MKSNHKLLASAVSGLLALGATSASLQAVADSHDKAKEKCYGVAKASKNDCAANGHACAGQAKTDADPNEWIYLPAGTCERLIDGSLKPAKK